MSNNPLRGKQNADVDWATAHTHAHTHNKRNNRIKGKKCSHGIKDAIQLG